MALEVQSIILNLVAGFGIFISLFLILSSLVGVARFKDFFSKIHAVSLTESLGLPFFIMAICLLSNGGIIIKIKLILIILIIWLFSPIATSNLAKAAYHRISKGKKDE